jgi:hypothetical protein
MSLEVLWLELQYAISEGGRWVVVVVGEGMDYKTSQVIPGAQVYMRRGYVFITGAQAHMRRGYFFHRRIPYVFAGGKKWPGGGGPSPPYSWRIT